MVRSSGGKRGLEGGGVAGEPFEETDERRAAVGFDLERGKRVGAGQAAVEDLRRLRLKGLIVPGTNRYTVTTYGLRAALFCSKLFLRLRPAWPALLPTGDPLIPRPLRTAFLKLENEIERLASNACFLPAVS